ncbi:MAG: hypothetical protein MPJ50_10355 [Pirellulales bacterium]|nr:hypothetical protein [Pirellulales bacterium]
MHYVDKSTVLTLRDGMGTYGAPALMSQSLEVDRETLSADVSTKQAKPVASTPLVELGCGPRNARLPQDRAAQSWPRFGLAVVLVVFAVATRPQLQFGHPLWNFAPMMAISLFAGAFFRKGWAFAVPITAIVLSDVAIEIAYRLGYSETWGFYAGAIYSYPAYVLLVGLGTLLRRPCERLSQRGVSGQLGFLGIALGGGAVGSVLFFLITNFGSWIELSLRYNIYELTPAGLMQCYAAGLAFYRQQMTWAGDLFYIAMLFGSYLAATALFPALSRMGSRPTMEHVQIRS